MRPGFSNPFDDDERSEDTHTDECEEKERDEDNPFHPQIPRNHEGRGKPGAVAPPSTWDDTDDEEVVNDED